MAKPTAIDLFCGGGGLSIGLMKAGFQVLFGVDNSEPAIIAYNLNLEHKCYDIDLSSQDSVERIKDHLDGKEIDLVAGGPPCQGFSSLGKKDDSDERNELFNHFLRVVNELKPRYFILENVTALATSRVDDRKPPTRVKVIQQRFADIGYTDTKCSIVKSSEFGVPQIRRRIIFTGSRGGKVDFNLPEGIFEKEDFVTVDDAISDLPSLKSGESSDSYNGPPKTDYQRNLRGDNKSVRNHKAPNHEDKIVKLFDKIPPGGKRKDYPELGWPEDEEKWHHNAYARLNPNSPAPAISTNFQKPSSNRTAHPTDSRGLTVREALRLQSFPDSYYLEGGLVNQTVIVGNSVPPILAEKLFSELASKLS